MEKGILDTLADQNGLFISDLRSSGIAPGFLLPQLARLMGTEDHSLEEWNESLTYVLGQPVSFSSIAEVRQFLGKERTQ